jgi:hypothetical protein
MLAKTSAQTNGRQMRANDGDGEGKGRDGKGKASGRTENEQMNGLLPSPTLPSMSAWIAKATGAEDGGFELAGDGLN